MKDSPSFVQFSMENVFHMNKEMTSQYIVQQFILHSRISYTYISVISFMRTPYSMKDSPFFVQISIENMFHLRIVITSQYCPAVQSTYMCIIYVYTLPSTLYPSIKTYVKDFPAPLGSYIYMYIDLFLYAVPYISWHFSPMHIHMALFIEIRSHIT